MNKRDELNSALRDYSVTDPSANGGRLLKVQASIAPGAGDATAANQVIEQGLLNDIKTNTANIKIDADTINLNTDGLEALIGITNANQTNKTQFTKITDGTDTLLVNADGSINANITLPSGVQTITSSVVTDDNTISAGATSIGFLTSSDFSGNINGVARVADTFYGFEAAMGKTLPAITYTTTTGSITIDKIV